MDVDRSHYLGKLASLRFITAFWVVIYHMGAVSVHYHNTLQTIYSYLYAYGYVGVSIFFVLSGFVISHANDNWAGWRKYLIGRITRIYPPHWIVTFTVALVFLMRYLERSDWHLDSWLPVISNLTLTQAWISDEKYYFSINAASWSLSVEIFFYISFIFLRRLQDNLIYILSAVTYLSLLISAATHDHSWNLNIYWDFFINPLARLPEFLVGMSLYRLYKKNRLPRLPAPRFNFIFIFIGMVITLAIAGEMSATGGGFKNIFTCSIIPIPFISLIMIALLDQASNKYMLNKKLILLGEASFALYLIHRSIIYFISSTFKEQLFTNGITATLFMILMAVTSIFMAVFFYKFIELPLTKRLKSMLIEKFVPAKL